MFLQRTGWVELTLKSWTLWRGDVYKATQLGWWHWKKEISTSWTSFIVSCYKIIKINKTQRFREMISPDLRLTDKAETYRVISMGKATLRGSLWSGFCHVKTSFVLRAWDVLVSDSACHVGTYRSGGTRRWSWRRWSNPHRGHTPDVHSPRGGAACPTAA